MYDSGVPYSVYVHHSLIVSLHKYKEELIRNTSTAFNQDIRFSRLILITLLICRYNCAFRSRLSNKSVQARRLTNDKAPRYTVLHSTHPEFSFSVFDHFWLRSVFVTYESWTTRFERKKPLWTCRNLETIVRQNARKTAIFKILSHCLFKMYRKRTQNTG